MSNWRKSTWVPPSGEISQAQLQSTRQVIWFDFSRKSIYTQVARDANNMYCNHLINEIYNSDRFIYKTKKTHKCSLRRWFQVVSRFFIYFADKNKSGAHAVFLRPLQGDSSLHTSGFVPPSGGGCSREGSTQETSHRHEDKSVLRWDKLLSVSSHVADKMFCCCCYYVCVFSHKPALCLVASTRYGHDEDNY